jgi:hypothetical protein
VAGLCGFMKEIPKALISNVSKIKIDTSNQVRNAKAIPDTMRFILTFSVF